MRRWISRLIGLAVVVLALVVVARNYRSPDAIGHALPLVDASDDGPRVPPAQSAAAAESIGEDAGPLLVSDLARGELRTDGGGPGTTLPDGSPVPPLPVSVSRQVRFGVVLVSYSGAQPSAGGVRPVARSKSDARILSERLRATAEQDFHAAVQQGDVGSSDDLGQVKLGILEPAPEYLLFTLSVHGVAGPVDTPRGFWIVKRLE